LGEFGRLVRVAVGRWPLAVAVGSWQVGVNLSALSLMLFALCL